MELDLTKISSFECFRKSREIEKNEKILPTSNFS